MVCHVCLFLGPSLTRLYFGRRVLRGIAHVDAAGHVATVLWCTPPNDSGPPSPMQWGQITVCIYLSCPNCSQEMRPYCEWPEDPTNISNKWQIVV